MSVFTMLRRMRGAGRHTSSAVAECSAGSSWLRREMPKAGVYLRQSGGKGEQRCVSLCARSRHATHRVELGLGEATQDDPQAGIRLRNESRAISLAGSSPHERSPKKLARRAPVRRWRVPNSSVLPGQRTEVRAPGCRRAISQVTHSAAQPGLGSWLSTCRGHD